jgi:hypothetical protein
MLPAPEKPVISVSEGVLITTSGPGFQWGNEDGFLAGETSRALKITMPGKYWVLVTSEDGCSVMSDTFYAVETHQLKIFPVPFVDHFSIEGGILVDKYFGYEIYSLQGQRILSCPTKKLTGYCDATIETGTWGEGPFILVVNYEGKIYNRLLFRGK